MSYQIAYADEKYIKGFHSVLDQVAKEQVYIEMIEAKPLDELEAFQKKLISNNWPIYYAISNQNVIGWIDVSVSANPRMAHRGSLAMGLLSAYRGKGIGGKLMQHALDHSKKVGLEKVELSVYTTNHAAIHLYKKFGFQNIGIIKHFRKLNGQYFDCIEMELFL
jgi:ribosomal protein S18 acetylase RimI-like enzyme